MTSDVTQGRRELRALRFATSRLLRARLGRGGQSLTAQALVERLQRLAIAATELGAGHGCDVQLRIDSGGLLIVASAVGDLRAAALVPWPEVLAHSGAVSEAMSDVVRIVEQKRVRSGADPPSCYPQRYPDASGPVELSG
jgi:hypothetical protein